MTADSRPGSVSRSLAILVLAAMVFLTLQSVFRAASGAAAAWIALSPWYERALYALVFGAVAWILLRRFLPWLFALPAPEPRQAVRPGLSSALLVGLAGGLLGLGLMFAFHWLRGSPEAPVFIANRARLGAALATWQGLLAFLPLMGLATPLLEEFFYRGLLTGFLREQDLHPALCLLLPALCFALVHPPAVFGLLFVLGLLFGVLFWRYGLPSAVVAHSTYNAGILFYTFLSAPGTCCPSPTAPA